MAVDGKQEGPKSGSTKGQAVEAGRYGTEFLTISREGRTILAIQSGDVALGPTRDEDRQYALDMLFNAIAAVTFLIPPYSTATTPLSREQTAAAAAPGVTRDFRAFPPYRYREG